MASIELGAHYETVGAKPSSTTKTDVLTCPAAPSKLWYVVCSLNICASDGVAGTADVFFYDGSVEYQLEKDTEVTAHGALRLNDIQLVLLPGQILRVTPSAANQHVTVQYLVGRPGE